MNKARYVIRTPDILANVVGLLTAHWHAMLNKGQPLAVTIQRTNRSLEQNRRYWLLVIFHATPENQSKLEALYGVKFEDAPKPVPVGSDLTRWLLAKHGKPVVCYVSDRSDGDAVDGAIRKISGVADGGNSFVTTGGTVWHYAVPINITELSTAADYVAD